MAAAHASQVTHGLDDGRLGTPFLDSLSLSVATRSLLHVTYNVTVQEIYFSALEFSEKTLRDGDFLGPSQPHVTHGIRDVCCMG